MGFYKCNNIAFWSVCMLDFSFDMMLRYLCLYCRPARFVFADSEMFNRAQTDAQKKEG